MGIVPQSWGILAEGPLEPDLAVLLPPARVVLAEFPGPKSDTTPAQCLYGTLCRAVVRRACVRHTCKMWTRYVHVCTAPAPGGCSVSLSAGAFIVMVSLPSLPDVGSENQRIARIYTRP